MKSSLLPNLPIVPPPRPPKVLTLPLDVTSRSGVEAAAKEVEKAFGSLDILINNAGYLEPFVKIADSDPDVWWSTHEINIKGVYLMTRSFISLLLKGEGKTIVSLSSIGGHIIMPGASAYQTGELALLRLMEFVCAEYGDQVCFWGGWRGLF